MSSKHTVTICGHRLDRPGHICAFFNSREQEYDVLTPYYIEGLEAGEQVVTIVDTDQRDAHCAQVQQRGVPEDAVANGQFRVLTAEDTYTVGGSFAATRMYDTLQGALAEAQRNGQRVRTSGVMDWSNREYPGTEELFEYEARVNVLVPLYDCTLLCVYDLSRVSGDLLMEILTTHPYVVHGRRVISNPYYRPPIEALREIKQDSITGQ